MSIGNSPTIHCQCSLLFIYSILLVSINLDVCSSKQMRSVQELLMVLLLALSSIVCDYSSTAVSTSTTHLVTDARKSNNLTFQSISIHFRYKKSKFFVLLLWKPRWQCGRELWPAIPTTPYAINYCIHSYLSLQSRVRWKNDADDNIDLMKVEINGSLLTSKGNNQTSFKHHKQIDCSLSTPSKVNNQTFVSESSCY
jgi:hypothetical protein